jgi:hypothetical protein
MATNDGTAGYTALDLAKATNELGQIEPVLDVVLRNQPIYEHAVWTSANRPEFHRVQQITATTASTKVGTEEGIPHNKTTRGWVDEQLAMFRDRSSIAKDSKILYGQSVEEYLNQEDKAKLSNMMTDLMTEWYSGNMATDPKGFNGVLQRLPALNTTFVGSPVFGAGGSNSGSMSSIYMAQWGLDACFMIHGMGSKSLGVNIEDMGMQRILDGSSLPYYAYEHVIGLDAGFVVRNTHSLGRVANIDLATSDVINANKVLLKSYQVKSRMVQGKQVYAYVSPDLYSYMKDYAFSRQNIWSKVDEYGHEITQFGGLTWAPMFSILDTETTVA